MFLIKLQISLDKSKLSKVMSHILEGVMKSHSHQCLNILFIQMKYL